VKTEKRDGKKILIWAIDPAQDPQDAMNLVKELKAWAARLKCQIQPVTVVSTSILKYPVAQVFRVERYEEATQRAADAYIKNFSGVAFCRPEVLFVKTFSNRMMAFELAKYAEAKKALMIFANTRAKQSWNPFRLGGFAETLAAASRTPVLLLNPEAQPSKEIPNILFPSDFGRESKNALAALTPWAKSFGSKILLFNQVELPVLVTPALNGYIPETPLDTEKIIVETEKARLAKAKRWAKWMADQGVPFATTVRRGKKFLPAEIVELALRHKVDLIAMSSHTSPAVAAVLGSNARDVILRARCPVLVFHRPKAARSATSAVKAAPDEELKQAALN
jgi:nucleotide-binding universal stress UspA family protein